MSLFENIQYIDVRMEDEFEGDFLLGNSLATIYRLRAENKLEPDSDSNETIIGLDLTNMAKSRMLPRSLDDLSYVIKEWPIFCFNYQGVIDKEDFVSNIIESLEESFQVLPIVKQSFLYDEREINLPVDKVYKSFLKGENQSVECPKETWELICNNLSFQNFNNHFEYSDEKFLDKTSVTWLGVTDPKVRRLFNHLFHNNISECSLDSEFITNNFNTEEKEILAKYLENSKLIVFDAIEGKFSFKFIRRKIIPQIRSRVFREFENEMERANVISIAHDTPKPSSFYWFFEFRRMFSYVNDVYIAKLSNILKQVVGENVIFDNICVYDTRNKENFTKYISKTFRTPLTKIIRADTPRFFPYQRVSENTKVLIITDVVNSGKTVNQMISLVEESKAQVEAIFSLVFNSELITENNSYFYKDKTYKIFYFLQRKLQKKEIQRDISRYTIYSDDTLTLRGLDYIFFWELIQKDGEVNRRHYFTESDKTQHQLSTHFDCMLDFNNIRESTLIRDFLTQFSQRLLERNLSLIISNTSKYAMPVAEIVRDTYYRDVNIVKFDFRRKVLDFEISDSDEILLVDDGVNSYSNLSSMMKLLVKKGIKKENINICTMITRKCIGQTSYTKSNKEELSECNILNYYKSSIPFFSTSDDDRVVCPICHAGDIYKNQLTYFRGIDEIENIIKDRLDRLLYKSPAPEKDPN